MAGWYVRRGEKVVGPVELPKLQELVAAGRIVPTDQIASDVAGPWKEAGRTKLFAKPKQTPVVKPETSPPPPTPLVSEPDRLPAVVEEPENGRAIGQVLHVVHIVFGGIGRGMLATWGAISRSMATRSQRKHELKLAKIKAKALSDSQRFQAQQPTPTTPPTRPIYVPQVKQTTVVQVVNKNKQSVYGCSGCAALLLLILIGLIVLGIMGNLTTQ